MELAGDTNKGAATVRAAQYVRMSTDHQRYSTENQAAAIQLYAAQRGFLIVRTYADEGRSGLRLHGRAALKQLIDDVQQQRADYSVLLVFDVSRWGRFQDADESAHYEFICRQAGISVCYCAEQFENDGSLQATLVKNLKRAMAAEYSRELSAKVHMGHCRLASLGFRQGGMAGYGFRRQLIDENRCPKGPLEFGQRKSLQTDRVTLIPGPSEEVETVRRIYHLFAYEGGNAYGIATLLNAEGRTNQFGRPWRYGMVYDILKSEKYAGDHVYNRESWKLQQFRGVNKPEDWIKVAGAFEPIVERDLFHAVQAERERRATARTNEEMLRHLSALLVKEGRLSATIINRQKGIPSSEMYRIRFGALCKAYELVGFKPRRGSRSVIAGRFIRQLKPRIVEDVTEIIENAGATVARSALPGLLRVNDEVCVSVTIARCYRMNWRRTQWGVRPRGSVAPEITIAARMDEKNEKCVDYLLLPHLAVGNRRPYLCIERDTPLWDEFRVSSLEQLRELFSRTEVGALCHLPLAGHKRARRVQKFADGRGTEGADLQIGSNRLAKMRARRIELERQRVREMAELAQNRLQSLASAFRKLLADDRFVSELRAEGLATLPKPLADRLEGQRTVGKTRGDNRENVGAAHGLLSLAIAAGYVSRLLQSSRVQDYLSQCHPELVNECRLIVAVASPDRRPTATR